MALLLAIAVRPCCASGPTLAPPPPPPPPELAGRLVADLGSDDFATREQAAARLAALAPTLPAARPLLAAAAAGGDAETARRARLLLDALARRQAAEEALAPQRLRLRCHDATVSEAIEALARASGARLRLDPAAAHATAERRLTLDTSEITFWEALHLLCAAAGIHDAAWREIGPPRLPPWGPQHHALRAQLGLFALPPLPAPLAESSPREATLALGSAPAPAACQVGALRLRVRPAARASQAGLAGLAGAAARWPATLGEHEILLGVEALGDPGLAGLRVQALVLDHARDDRGQTLAQSEAWFEERPAAALESWLLDNGGGPVAGGPTLVPLRLAGGPRPARVLRELSATLTVCVRLPLAARVTVPDLAAALGQRVDGPQGEFLRVLRMPPSGQAGELCLEVGLPPAELAEAAAGGVRRWAGGGWKVPDDAPGTAGRFRVCDRTGQPVPLEREEYLDPADGQPAQVRLTLHPRPGQAPARLVWLGRRSVVVEVPFRVRDVPLTEDPALPPSAGTRPASLPTARTGF